MSREEDELDGSVVGEECVVDETATVVEPSSLGNGVLIGAHSIIGPDTSISNHVQMGQGCRIERSIIFPGVTIGDGANVGSGSVVVESVPAGATVIGVPGRITRINGSRLGSQPASVLDHHRLSQPVIIKLGSSGSPDPELLQLL